MKQFAEKREHEKEVLQKAIEESCNFSKMTQERLNQKMEANKESRTAQMAALTEKFKARVRPDCHVDLCSFNAGVMETAALWFFYFFFNRTRSLTKWERNWGNKRSGKLICLSSVGFDLYYPSVAVCVSCDSLLYDIRLGVNIIFFTLLDWLLFASFMVCSIHFYYLLNTISEAISAIYININSYIFSLSGILLKCSFSSYCWNALKWWMFEYAVTMNESLNSIYSYFSS